MKVAGEETVTAEMLQASDRKILQFPCTFKQDIEQEREATEEEAL